MKKELSLAYSPCPNDTFLFYNLVHEKVSEKIKVKEELHDVEALNISAKEKKYDSTKLSFFASFSVFNHYKIMNSGSALGNGCGPILITRKGFKGSNPSGKKILIPGLLTTANLLLNLFLKKNFIPVPVRYDLVIPKLLSGEYNYGVIIHEERFTYEKRGLEKIQDLGEFWEEKTGKPIPLGCISVKRELDEEIQMELDRSIQKSLELGWGNPEKARQYILSNSQSTDPVVVDSHIKLYVNNYTRNLGETGRTAILTLLEEATKIGLIEEPEFDPRWIFVPESS
jgi:1,4-dihydroxy-6-naphthoate synthase